MKLIWTEDELDLLRTHYPTMDMEKLSELLPRFSIDKIREKASKLGIKRKVRSKPKKYNKMIRWTDDEIEQLKQVYSHTPNEELEKMFPRFDLRKIRTKARSLGLEKLDDIKKVDQDNKLSKMLGESEWSAEEIGILEENYKIMGSVGLQKLLPNRTQKAISSQAMKMGLSTEKEAVWDMTGFKVSDDDLFSINVTFERVDR